MKNLVKIFLIMLFVISFVKIQSQTIVINEIMFKPGPSTTGCDQKLMSQPQPTCGREYIELYNSDCNNNYDLSGYVLASANTIGSTIGNAGSICFPPGTVVPAGSFLIIGGANDHNPTANGTFDYPANSFDFKIPNYFSTQYLCLNTANTYWFLGNYDGWMALYEPTGNIHSAVYWSSAANNISTVADFDVNPCSPTAYTGIQLKSAKQIYQSTPTLIQYMGDAATVNTGNTFSRLPDGGAFQSNRPSTIGPLRSNRCNDGLCIACGNLVLSSTPDTCNQHTGTIRAEIMNQIASPAPYTYNVTGPINIGPIVTSNNPYFFNNLPSGTYVVKVDDSFSPSNHTEVSLVVVATGSISIANITSTPDNCNMGNGTATVTAAGASTYTYIWNTNPIQNTQTATNLVQGQYSVTVNSGGCSVVDNITVGTTGSVSITDITFSPASCNSSDGTATVTSSGGNGTYTYIWNTNPIQNTQTATNLSQGQYSVTVTSGSCSTSGNIVITGESGPTIIMSSTSEHCGMSDGSVSVTATGGSGNYTYIWNTTPINNSTSITGLPAGSYTVTVSDGGSCLPNATAIVTNLNNLNADFSSQPSEMDDMNPICNFNDLSIGNVNLWLWNFGDGTSSNNPSPIHTFNGVGSYNVSLIVTDIYGCVDTAVHTVRVSTEVNFYFPNSFTPNRDALNETFGPSIPFNDLMTYDFRIFNKWGEQIFYSSNINQRWDGSKNGNILPQDVYIYIMYARESSGLEHKFIGRVALIK